MAAHRPLARLAAALLGALYLAAPAAHAAQPPGASALTVAADRQGVQVALVCPEPGLRQALAVDGTLVTPLERAALGAAHPALALVVDTSAPMGAAGTPHSTRLRDAAQLAGLLLALAPPETPVALVALGGPPHVALPLTTDRAAALEALAALSAGPAGPGQAAPLAEALALAAAQLEAAPAGPRAVAAFVAEGRAVASPAGPAAVAARALVVGHGPATPPAEGAGPTPLARAAATLGASYALHAGDEAADLPALHRSAEGRFRALLAPGERLGITLPAVGPGPHLLTVEGCGAPLAAAFGGPAEPPIAVGAGVALAGAALGGALGTWWQRRRLPGPRVAPLAASTTARLLAAAAITTARRASGPVGPAGLRAVLLDGRERRSVALEGRHWTIGSDPGCAIVVAGAGVAPLHARLSLAGDGLTITDLESAGGTRLGALGPRLAPGEAAALAEGELVLLGESCRLMVERACAGPEGAP